MSVPRGPGAPSLPERALRGLARLALRGPWPGNGRIVVQGVFGFLMQVVRSRTLGLPSRRGGPEG